MVLLHFSEIAKWISLSSFAWWSSRAFMSLYLNTQHFLGLGQNFLLLNCMEQKMKNTIRAHNPGPVLPIMEFCSIYQITWTICQALVSSTKVLWLNNERKWEDVLWFQNAAFKICPWILVTLLSAALSHVKHNHGNRSADSCASVVFLMLQFSMGWRIGKRCFSFT